MSTILQHIQKLESLPGYTKHDRIIEGIINSIENEIVKNGDNLPSINQLANNLGFAKETIVKAYGALKERGIVNSKQGLGYYVTDDKLKTQLRIALVMYGFQAFQQTFYNTLRKSLGSKFKIDVFFHHNNMDVYKSILQNVRTKYGLYVIAPIQDPKAEVLLHDFPAKKILIVDRYQFLNENVAHVTQEFEIALKPIFNHLCEKLKSFSKVIFFYKSGSDYPLGIKKAFNQFCLHESITFEEHDEYDFNLLEKDTVYFTIGDGDLWPLVKDAKEANFEIGKDIGILSHNDSPVKELVEGGITTISTDFTLMAEKASEYIKTRKMVKEIIPMKLIKRKSL